MAVFKVLDGNVVIIPAPSDVSLRDVVPFGTTNIGVAQTEGLTGEDISVELVGVYELPADTTEGFSIGDTALWDVDNKVVISTGTVTAGLILSEKVAGADGTVLVKIG